MIQRSLVVVITLLSLLVLQGCATKKSLPDLPATLDNKGLLVARIHVLGMQAMESASLNIDGKFISSGLREGYLAVPLEPGDHTLVQLRAQGQLLSSQLIEDDSPYRKVKGGGGGTYIFIPGSSYTINYTTLSIDRKFHIDAGKVTNLGLIVYIPVVDAPGTKKATVNNAREFNVVTVDNSEEIDVFLETNYPEFVKTIRDRKISLAPTNYLDQKRIPALRRVIAYYESRGPRYLSTPTKTIFFGKAGTIAAIDKQDPARTEILETGTLADIVGAVSRGGDFDFLTSDAQLISWRAGEITKASLPFRIHAVQLNPLGESGLVIADNRMRILTLQNPEGQWVKYEGLMIGSPRSDIRMTSDDEGTYIALGNQGIPAIYYLNAGASIPKPIISPVDKSLRVSNSEFNYTIARSAGLFVLFNKPDFIFWSKSRQRWNYHSVPSGKCKPLKIEEDGLNLSVECDAINYRSSNSGASWVKQDI